MSVRALSTAVSDCFLAGCSFYAALSVCKTSIYAGWGFACVALAASFGVLKFGVVFPDIQSKVIRLHLLFTWLASVVGETVVRYLEVERGNHTQLTVLVRIYIMQLSMLCTREGTTG